MSYRLERWADGEGVELATAAEQDARYLDVDLATLAAETERAQEWRSLGAARGPLADARRKDDEEEEEEFEDEEAAEDDEAQEDEEDEFDDDFDDEEFDDEDDEDFEDDDFEDDEEA